MSPKSRFLGVLPTAVGLLAAFVLTPATAVQNKMLAVEKISQVQNLLIGTSSCTDQLEDQFDEEGIQVVYWLREAEGIVRFTVSPAARDDQIEVGYSGRVENYRGDILFRQNGKATGDDLDDACEAAARVFAKALKGARE